MLSLMSPAKINLFLRILHRRDDGFHELASLFQAIDLFDTLHITLTDKDCLTCDDKTLPLDSSNLILKATDLFRRKTGINKGLTVHLEKKIPQQAGLGGGSSNAATTLWAFNALCGHPVKEEMLAKWASEIGSDIPFFLSQGTAYCTGRGEILKNLSPLRHSYLWIIKPPQGLATKKIYERVNPIQFSDRNPQVILDSFFTSNPIYFNDLEIPAFEIMPELSHFKNKLYESGFSTVLMSGSGSSFFCIGDGVLPHIPGYISCCAQFINRKSDSWYS